VRATRRRRAPTGLGGAAVESGAEPAELGDDRRAPLVSGSGGCRERRAQLGLAAGWLGRRPAGLRCCAGLPGRKGWARWAAAQAGGLGRGLGIVFWFGNLGI
jgi:hypothetical protein